MRPFIWAFVTGSTTGIASAVVVSPSSAHVRPRAAKSDLPGSAATDAPLLNSIDLPDTLESVLNGVVSDIQEVSAIFNAFASVLTAAKPTTTPSNPPDAQATVSSIFASYASSPTPDLLADAVRLIENGFAPADARTGPASTKNYNTRDPSSVIFPKADDGDAPYSQSEDILRGALYIPDTFTYGDKTPVILVPGTGVSSAWANYNDNIGKLLKDSPIADIVYLNIPNAVYDDIQVNAEFVAYAIGYISGITGKEVATVAWSQGSINSAWALQYWPSTQKKVNNMIIYSGDYHGTVNAYLLNPGFPKLPSAPAIIQQDYNSTFIKTLRDGGGASAYVPTTTIYSAFFDEIVQPQTLGGASSFLLDERNVGVSNHEIQSICSGRPGGGFYTHEGVLYNPLAYALTVDALTNGGPGRLSRIDLDSVCNDIVTPGLVLSDVLGTEATFVNFFLNLFEYEPKTLDEPPIKSYAA